MDLKKIPHIYHNTVYSRKLFEIFDKKFKKFSDILQLLSNFNNLDKLEGLLLDIKGNNYGIERKGKSDEDYRNEIKFELLRINRFGGYLEMKEILNNYFNISVEIIELSGKIRAITLTDKVKVLEKLKLLKPAGIGINVQKEEYVSDYLISELADMDLNKISQIKLKGEINE